MPPKHETLSEDELQALVLEILQKSSKPLHAADVLKQLPRLYKVPKVRVASLLTSLHQAGTIFLWSVSRERASFGAESPQQRARHSVLEALHQPQSPVELKKQTLRGLPGCPAKEAAQLFRHSLDELVQQGVVVKYPKAGEFYAVPPKRPTLEQALKSLREQFPEAGPEAISEAIRRAFATSVSLAERIQQAILATEPRANQGALASIPKVRLQLDPPVPKEQFDSAVLDLGRRGLLSVHIFYGHAQISEQERDELVFDQKETYYGGVTFRSH